MSRVFDNGGDVSIHRMRVGSITVHCSTPQPRSHVDDYYDSEEEGGGRYLLTPDRGRSRSGSRSRSTSRERAGYGEGGFCDEDYTHRSDNEAFEDDGWHGSPRRLRSRSRSGYGSRSTPPAFQNDYQNSSSSTSTVQGIIDMYSTETFTPSHHHRSQDSDIIHPQPQARFRKPSWQSLPSSPSPISQSQLYGSTPSPMPPRTVVQTTSPFPSPNPSPCLPRPSPYGVSHRALPPMPGPSNPSLPSSHNGTLVPHAYATQQQGHGSSGYMNPSAVNAVALPEPTRVYYVVPQYYYCPVYYMPTTSQQVVVYSKKKKRSKKGKGRYFQ